MDLLASGTYAVGCNYWASHAGTAMWRCWDEATVRSDLARLAGIGLQVVRVFPLWPDFQPLDLHRMYGGNRRELRLAGRPLPATAAGQAGVSEEALARFRTLADCAAEHGLRLVVGLITGWMSGELFVPPAFAGLNMLTDPLALRWQVAFLRHFVRTFRDHPAILAWEPGNECNCMASVDSQEQAWLWTHTITAAIRNEDSTRPVASGMHGLYPGSEREFGGGKGFCWTIRDQGSLCDLMTSHPYPHSPSKKPARVDRVGSLRSNFQAVVESRLYADLGGKPCLVEEIGTFGPMVCDEARQASFIRSVLWNTWAHDCRGLLWWCGFEQADLEQSPYDWNAWERELGLFRRDLSPKPVAAELGTFRRLLDNLPPLPPFRRDAVCLLPRELSPEDYLENAWSCFLLAKQAGFDLEFHYADDPLRDSSLYLIPGVKGQGGLSRHLWLELMERASAGATVFLSLDSGHLSPFSECFGLRVRNREAREGGVQFAFAGQTFSCRSPYRLELVPEGAEILAAEPDGNPVLSRFRRGRGTIWLLTCPVESHLAGKPGAFAPGAPPFWRIYQAVAETALVQRLVRRREPQLTLTEHLLAPNQAVALLYNHLETELEDELTLAPGWRIVEALPESGLQGGTRVRLPAGSGLILRLTADTRTRSRE